MSVPLRRLQQAPRHLLVCEKGNARHARSRHAVHVRDHAYNCRVSAGGGGARTGIEARLGRVLELCGRKGQRGEQTLASGLLWASLFQSAYLSSRSCWLSRARSFMFLSLFLVSIPRAFQIRLALRVCSQQVSVLIPECGLLPEVLKGALADIGEYYVVRSLSVHQLLSHEFIDCFVRKGKDVWHAQR